MYHHFKTNIDAHTTQSIAKNLWRAYEKLFFDDGKEIHFKRKDDMYSLEGKTNKSGIRFLKEKEMLCWRKLSIPVVIDKNNSYEVQAIQNEIAYCRIVRKMVKGKYKFYIQLVLKGIPPIKHSLGKGTIELDIDISSIATISKNEVHLLKLAKWDDNFESKISVLQQKMDRSLRAMNPANYNEDGTIKKSEKKLGWVRSNHYNKMVCQLRELYRKQTAVRKYQHECLANEILAMGDEFYIGKKDFRFLQKNKNGKEIANHAPAMLMRIVERKLRYHEKGLIL